MTHSFCNWKFVPLNLPHLFLSLCNPSLATSVYSIYIYGFFCFVMFVHLFFRFHILREIIEFLSFSDYFTQNNILSAIHVVTNSKILFLCNSNIPLYIETTSLSIHLLMSTYIASIILAIVNKATMNTGGHISFLISAFVAFR